MTRRTGGIWTAGDDCIKSVLLILIFVLVLYFLKTKEVMIYLYLLTSVLELKEFPLTTAALWWGGVGQPMKPCVHIHRGGENKIQTQFWRHWRYLSSQSTGAEFPEKKMYRVPCEIQHTRCMMISILDEIDFDFLWCLKRSENIGCSEECPPRKL